MASRVEGIPARLRLVRPARPRRPGRRAVTGSHPQRALEIYHRQVDRLLTQADVKAYEAVASYLRKMKPIMESLDQAGDWTALIGRD